MIHIVSGKLQLKVIYKHAAPTYQLLGLNFIWPLIKVKFGLRQPEFLIQRPVPRESRVKPRISSQRAITLCYQRLRFADETLCSDEGRGQEFVKIYLWNFIIILEAVRDNGLD